MINKQDLRKKYLGLKRALPLKEQHLFLASMLNHFAEIGPLPAGKVLSYKGIAVNGEVFMDVFEDFLTTNLEGPFQFCYPAVNFKFPIMDAFEDDDKLVWEHAPFNLLQPQDGTIVSPAELKIVFMPLLAFDKKGQRLGYGKGYYDRYLARCSPDVIKIGFSWFEPVDEMPEINRYDLPLNYCVTPHRLYVF